MADIPGERTLMSLILPGTHNSATYQTKNHLGLVKKFVKCQKLDIYSQLKCGVRVLDLRLTYL